MPFGPPVRLWPGGDDDGVQQNRPEFLLQPPGVYGIIVVHYGPELHLASDFCATIFTHHTLPFLRCTLQLWQPQPSRDSYGMCLVKCLSRWPLTYVSLSTWERRRTTRY